MERARTPQQVELLWRVCQVPDFRKLLLDRHAEMLAQVYLQLSGTPGCIDPDWMAARIAQIDDIDAGIDLLMTRMAFIRTWAYITGQAGWVADAPTWRQRTREVEDRLSDALHEALVFRFVRDGGGSRTRHRVTPSAPRTSRSKSRVEVAEPVDGPFAGLAAMRDAMEEPRDDRELGSAAWVAALSDAPHEAFVLDARGRVHWRDACVARLKPGRSLLHPNLALEDEASLALGARRQVHARLLAWTRDWLGRLLAPLDDASDAQAGERGISHALRSGLGCVEVSSVARQVGELPKGRRALLKERGIIVGRQFVYCAPMLHPRVLGERAVLCWSQLGRHDDAPDLSDAPTVLELDDGIGAEAYLAIGFVPVRGRGLRVDACEELLAELDRVGRGQGSLAAVTASLAEQLGVDVSESELIDGIERWGWTWTGERLRRQRHGRRRPKKRR